MNWPWWDGAGLLPGVSRAGEGRGEAGGLGDRTGELEVGRSSEGSRCPQAEQNRPVAGTSVPQFAQRTTIASVIGARKTSSSGVLMIVEVPNVHRVGSASVRTPIIPGLDWSET